MATDGLPYKPTFLNILANREFGPKPSFSHYFHGLGLNSRPNREFKNDVSKKFVMFSEKLANDGRGGDALSIHFR